MSSTDADHVQLAGTAEQLMRRMLSELNRVRTLAARNAEQIRSLREGVDKQLVDAEAAARREADTFAPRNLGAELREDLAHAFGIVAARFEEVEPAPRTLEDARQEWEALSGSVQGPARALVRAREAWGAKRLRRRSTMPQLPADLWRATQRLVEVHDALPALRKQHVAEQMTAASHLNADLAVEIELRSAALAESFAAARTVLAEVEQDAGLTGAPWTSPAWRVAEPARRLGRTVRLGVFEPKLQRSADIAELPAYLEHPLSSGVAIRADVAHRQQAIELARSLGLRMLFATPPGDLRFVFVDPVSLGRSVADFRHLAEFDPSLVDVKTWTSEREIETRLDELASHLEVVISTYLRGQFDSIDEYNQHAGEVAEPYRVLVVFDYPAGFTDRSAGQLLSLIENGTRCGLHVILHTDPAQAGPDAVPLARLVHSMQAVDLTRDAGRVTLPEPVGAVDLDFRPDMCPPISFSSDGRPQSPAAELLHAVGAASRSTQNGPVTIARVVPILNKLIARGTATTAPQLLPGGRELSVEDPASWWNATSAAGACAPIGRAGAQDLASMYFSSTEVAGGAIVVGLPRTGKSTALHSAITSLAMIYPPSELELYLIDGKHGVEFKAYDRLPHARLVSINSEREFSVAVLQSLDGEIKRRAELMKRHTAGRANITEYRATTGEEMARIVLFMDEFHEVFEEDDAMGHAAFQAFSNIVRQGPFAGVHVVVSSQTLSSMPAMDRNTLSLLPMRIAFMCNESDGDLVMGDLNRDVKALTQVGQGIFNPARGEPSFNKPFRGTYIAPEERAALLDAVLERARQAGIERRPRVFDGDRVADRPAPAAGGTGTRAVLAIGEPFGLDDSFSLTLRRGRGANVIVLGATGTEDGANEATTGAVHSCLVGAATSGLTTDVVDFIGDDEDDHALSVLDLCERLGVRYRRASGLRAALSELLSHIEQRRRAEDYRRTGALLLLHGLQRAIDVTPPDPFADPDGQPALGQMLADVLRDGPEVGCHVAVAVEGMAQFERRLGRDLLGEFDWRLISAGVAKSDVASATESFNEPEIRPGQLLVVDAGSGRMRRVRAYAPFTPSTLDLITPGSTM